jgi:hypothetical protein
LSNIIKNLTLGTFFRTFFSKEHLFLLHLGVEWWWNCEKARAWPATNLPGENNTNMQRAGKT